MTTAWRHNAPQSGRKRSPGACLDDGCTIDLALMAAQGVGRQGWLFTGDPDNPATVVADAHRA